jgi:hypothetical protein
MALRLLRSTYFLNVLALWISAHTAVQSPEKERWQVNGGRGIDVGYREHLERQAVALDPEHPDVPALAAVNGEAPHRIR